MIYTTPIYMRQSVSFLNFHNWNKELVVNMVWYTCVPTVESKERARKEREIRRERRVERGNMLYFS